MSQEYHADVPWDDKISWTTETTDAKTIHIVGC